MSQSLVDLINAARARSGWAPGPPGNVVFENDHLPPEHVGLPGPVALPWVPPPGQEPPDTTPPAPIHTVEPLEIPVPMLPPSGVRHAPIPPDYVDLTSSGAEWAGHKIHLTADEVRDIKTVLGRAVLRQLDAERERVQNAVFPPTGGRKAVSERGHRRLKAVRCPRPSPPLVPAATPRDMPEQLVLPLFDPPPPAAPESLRPVPGAAPDGDNATPDARPTAPHPHDSDDPRPGGVRQRDGAKPPHTKKGRRALVR